MFLRWSYMFFAVIALLLTTPLLNAQESTVNQKSEYLQRDDLGADYKTAIEKLHEAANKLNELESALSVSLTNTEGQVDKLRPASCEFIDQKLSWDGTQWVCSDDVNEELEWYASSGWSGCSASCGGGTMSRSIGCRMKIAGTVVGTSYCTNLAANSRPSSSQSCNTQACTAAWSVGGWGSCSASCGGGVQTRSVSCPSGYVCTGSRPSSSQSCNTQACAPVMSGCAGGSNSVGSWPATSHGQTIYGTCAAGTSGTFRGYCNNGSASVTINTCVSTAPTPTTGAWTAGGWSAWSACSKSCGSGTQSRTRSVTCNYSSCTGSKPSTSESRACNTQACASANCSAGTVQLRICSVSVSAIANGSSQHHSCLSPSRGTECAGMVRCNNGVLSASGISCVQQCIAGPGRCF